MDARHFLLPAVLLLAALPAAAQCTLSSASPSVTICQLAPNSTVASPVHVVAGTTSSPAATLIQIYLDGVKVFQIASDHLDTSVSMATGTHRLTVQAYNGTWFKSTEYVTVGTSNDNKCQLSATSPSVTICEPAPNATVTSPVHIVAGTTSSPQATMMQIYLDGVKAYQVSASSLDTTLPMSNATHRLTVQAYNGAWFKSTEYITVGGSGGTGASVTVSPASVTIVPGATQQFTATVTGLSNTSVTWWVDNIQGGDSGTGTISSSGLYTAPGGSGTHTVTAVSVADSTKRGNATVNVSSSPPPPPPSGSFSGLFTYKNNNARQGANTSETILTPSNVRSATFGKLFTLAVDGYVYAQPLYVPGLTINGVSRNVLFVATEHDSVYAFDADGRTLSPLWKRSFLSTGVTTIPQTDVGSTIVPEIGITSTPVIDPGTNTLYVVAATKEGGGYVQRLHALDLITGSEKMGGPVTIRASVRGTGDGTDGSGNVAFQPKIELQRAALLLSGGVVYIAWASHGDHGLYHGWVMGYNASTLQQVAVHNNTPNGRRGGIWQSGGGLSADGNGNIYYISGNGTFSAASGGNGYGDSFVKLSPSGAVLDFFTPFDQDYDNSHDRDLGSSGPTLLPGGFVTGGGKDGHIYLINTANMGRFQSGSNSQITQFLPGANGNHMHMQPVYWNGTVYYNGEFEPIRAFSFSGGRLSNSPTSRTSMIFGGSSMGGTNPALSANGTSNGILWAIERTSSSAAVLHAFDATNLAVELYNSNQAGTRDQMSAGHIKFVPPAIANGKVYVGLKKAVTVFGLR